MTKRRTIRIWNRELRSYELDYHTNLPDFIAKIRSVASDVPDDQLENVSVDFVSGDSCESGYLDFTYSRDETDEEMKNRIANEEHDKKMQEKAAELRERNLLARLKWKYEGHSLEQGGISDRLANFDEWGNRIRNRS